MIKYIKSIIFRNDTNIIKFHVNEVDRRYIDGYKKLWIENIRDYSP